MNFETICRTCSSEGELQSLFVKDPFTIADMLTEIIDIKVRRDDNFPQSICNYCLEKLKSAYEFKKQCQTITIKFEEYLNSIRVKEEILVDSIKQEHSIEDDSNHNWDDTYESPSGSPEPEIKENKSVMGTQKKKGTKKKDLANRKRKYVCNICNKSITNLHEHLRSHTKEKPYKCETCGQQFSIKCNYQRHLKIHTGERPHVCTICGRSFIQKTALHVHIQGHSDETSLTCSHCGKTYQYRHQLRYHLRLKHSDELKPTENGKFECKICNKNFSTNEILATHKLFHVEKSYLCSHCGKGFVRKSGLQSHIKTHTGEKPYKCTFCDKSFSHVASFNTHQLIHTGEKPFKCTFCGKEFAHRLSYNSHQLIHTGDKPHKCDICNQSFRQKTHLKYHSFTHTGEKLYKCSMCDKQFALKGNLTVHMRTHTGETPYICSICNKGFYDSSSMKKHKKKHLLAENDIVQEKSFDLSLANIEK